jgi:hypothetical protein
MRGIKAQTVYGDMQISVSLKIINKPEDNKYER